jgi:hypothetical protein
MLMIRNCANFIIFLISSFFLIKNCFLFDIRNRLSFIFLLDLWHCTHWIIKFLIKRKLAKLLTERWEKNLKNILIIIFQLLITMTIKEWEEKKYFEFFFWFWYLCWSWIKYGIISLFLLTPLWIFIFSNLPPFIVHKRFRTFSSNDDNDFLYGFSISFSFCCETADVTEEKVF